MSCVLLEICKGIFLQFFFRGSRGSSDLFFVLVLGRTAFVALRATGFFGVDVWGLGRLWERSVSGLALLLLLLLLGMACREDGRGRGCTILRFTLLLLLRGVMLDMR